jgi:signal transduction histidine kinase
MSLTVIQDDESSDVVIQQPSFGPQENAGVECHELARVGALLPGIVHNLSTPLSGVLGGIQMLEMRALNIAESIEKGKKPTGAQWKELVNHLDRNQKTVELVARNAQNLSTLMQNLANRIALGSVKTSDIHSLNQIVQVEMLFLESNLTFKHRVRKFVHLADDLPPLKCVFSVFAEAFDEVIYVAMACHEPTQNASLPEMTFTTAVEPGSLILRVDCNTPVSLFEQRPAPDSGPISAPSLHEYFERLRQDNWEVEMRATDIGTVFELKHPPAVFASQK